ncbi:arsenate reductase (glutaredoxin) [Nitrosospira briensis]|uniref:Arsenate reductase n=1 Tax=Nitrosospira briensis TaxID=35799 RepID=A0A1I4XVA7_9PROT|nr:arsenate reductase (glutaredoxin) [Nitrosospira briensis]SFN29606.1 arsenate reductase [Nitrosospira briensis]SFN65264.1 arsenate reductase [Nitrosospira briensis]
MSDRIVVYQKPTCSKCRATLALLENSGKEFDAVNYYEVPLTVEQLRELIDKLGLQVRDILRSEEPLARRLGLAERQLSDDELIRIMVENPDLIQRPIVVRGDEAVLCRPPENVKKFL